MVDDERELSVAPDDGLRQPWWFSECERIPKYMPPHPRDDTEPRFVVKHVPSNSFLRHSAGPRQGHFWDSYGDDYLRDDLARLAISQAPPPPKATPPPAVAELEELRALVRRQRNAYEEQKQKLHERDKTITFLRNKIQAIGAAAESAGFRSDLS